MAPSIYTVSLPVNQDLESRAILKKLAKAHQALAELKGVASSIPNQSILSNTLALQEAKDSSAIENIITTLMMSIKATAYPSNLSHWQPKRSMIMLLLFKTVLSACKEQDY
jgi:hypothetical protein